jgi:hypothetical protein
MDSLASARGFEFWCDADSPLVMGDEGAAAGAGSFSVTLPKQARVRLLRDGQQVAAADAATELHHQAEGPGVYRVEAYLHAAGRERTWILSNPIYLR